MSILKVATIQTQLYWEDIDANLAMFSDKIASLNEKVDVIVLPEMFSTGFSMNTELAETQDGKAMQWMQQTAAIHNTAVCGSLMMKNRHDVFNRFIWMNPNGIYHVYNKRHLFRMGNEHEHYKAGDEKLIIDFKGLKIQLLVCYDLRFPVWSRRTLKENYDALFIVANWPQRRAEHWKTLLKARAIENQCYVVGVNRVGNDGKDIYHSGDTSFIDARGETIYQKTDEEHIAVHLLEKEKVTAYRVDFPAMNDADEFTLL